MAIGRPMITAKLRATLGIDDDTLLVGGSGRFDLCKGVALFPIICDAVTARSLTSCGSAAAVTNISSVSPGEIPI